MIKILCFFGLLGMTFASYGQDLFPELAKKSAETPESAAAAPVPSPEEVPSLFANESGNESRAEIVQRIQKEGFGEAGADAGGENLSENLAAGVAQQQQPTTGKGYFVISPSEVQIVEPSVARFQFCMAALNLTNNTKNTLRGVNLYVHYTPINMPIVFGSVQPGQSASQKIYLASEACQMLTKVPEITVEACEAENMTEEECKSTIKYITDLQLVSETQQ